MGIDVEPALRLTTTFGDGAGEFEGSLNQSIQLSIEAGIAALEGAPRGGGGGLRAVGPRSPAGRDLFTHGLVTVEAATALPACLVPEDAIDSPPRPPGSHRRRPHAGPSRRVPRHITQSGPWFRCMNPGTART